VLHRDIRDDARWCTAQLTRCELELVLCLLGIGAPKPMRQCLGWSRRPSTR